MSMSIAQSEIVRILGQLESLPDGTAVVVRPDGERQCLEEDYHLVRRHTEAALLNATIRFLGDVIFVDGGPGAEQAADEAEVLLWDEAKKNSRLSAAFCRNLLLRNLPARIRERLDTFIAEMPQSSMQAIGFTEMPLSMRLAIMEGFMQGDAMLRAVCELQEKHPALFAGSEARLSSEALAAVRVAVPAAIRSWEESMRTLLPARTRQADLPRAQQAVRRLLQFARPKLFLAFIETIAMSPVADVFTLQRSLTGELARFARFAPLPPGMDATAYVATLARFQDLLFEAVCRHISYHKKVTVRRLVEDEAKMFLQANPRFALSGILRLHCNDLLANIPSERELRIRGGVNGFDTDGIHADCIRDCVARRYSLTIEGVGTLRNASDREHAVAGGRRDQEFFEKQIEKYARAMFERRQRIDQGLAEPEDLMEDEAPGWEIPDARKTPSLTPEDVREAREALITGIPDISTRMALTVLANRGALKALEAVYGSDCGPGLSLESPQSHMKIIFSPGTGELRVSAMLFHDAITPAIGGQGETTVPLGEISFTQAEYTITLRRKRNKDKSYAAGWQAATVQVDSLFTYLIPARGGTEKPA